MSKGFATDNLITKKPKKKVISNDLEAESIQRIATENNSDHDGINCSIKFA